MSWHYLGCQQMVGEETACVQVEEASLDKGVVPVAKRDAEQEQKQLSLAGH